MEYRKVFDGSQWVLTFENGYGLSVICHERSYGGKEGLFEAGLIHEGVLCYSHPDWPDVRGWLTFQDVARMATKVSNYEAAHSYCSSLHGIDQEVSK